MTTAAPMVRLVHAGLTFGDAGAGQVRAVQDVSLDVPRGKLTLVMGPSGSGKTSLLSLVGGILSATEGEVAVDGVSLGGLTQAALTAFRLERIGFVFQAFHLLAALTVRENIELPLFLKGGRRPASSERAQALAVRLGLSHRLNTRPRTLSGGEQQRVAIARALANDPVLLLADEPTGSLDSRAGQEVIALLHAAAVDDGKAVMVVSHDARLCDYADSIVQMRDGRILGVERGTTQSTGVPA